MSQVTQHLVRDWLLVALLWPLMALPLSGVGSAAAQDSVSISHRVASRGRPSIFQAWNPASNLQKESAEHTEGRHDLLFHDAGFFWLHWNHRHHGLATGFTDESIANARRRRERLLKRNPNMVLLCEIRYRDAHRSYLPEDHEWWMRDEHRKRIVGWAEGEYFLLDFQNAAFRKHVVNQAVAAVRSRVVDGVMLDWWREDDARVALVREIRAAIGNDALILVNSNDRQAPRSAKYINGLYMECYRSESPKDWSRIVSTLSWAEKHLREPRINCVETWFKMSRKDLRKMRATTTLVLTHSDGYALFSDPNELPTPDHLHDWYDFWDAPLGKPLNSPVQQLESATVRKFENGVAVYNPLGGNTVTIELAATHRSIHSGMQGRKHRIAPGDGDLLIRSEEE